MKSRHSVRAYLDKPIEQEKKDKLTHLAKKLNEEFSTNAQLFFDDPDGFKNSKTGYGAFKGCNNFIALVGEIAEKCGYVGEILALKAQELGLNTCFVALTYKKGNVKKKIELKRKEKLQCSIAIGYGETQGIKRKSKTENDVLEVVGDRPKNLSDVVEACLLAPTAINQQKFKIVCNMGEIEVKRHGFGFYADVDLGIVKSHKDLILEKIDLDGNVL